MKKSSKTSTGNSGTVTVGPVGDVKSWMVTGLNFVVHLVGSDPVHNVDC